MAAQLTAAAARYTRKPTRNTVTPASVSGQGWQEEAWRFFDATPEVRFAATWIGNAMSGATLFAGRRAEDGTIERAPDDHLAAELVQRIATGPDGQSQILGDFGPHLVVPGEGWIVIRPTLDAAGLVTGEEWRVLSTSEVRSGNGEMTAEIDGEQIKIPEYDPDNPDDTAPVAIRVWQPHPRRHIEADSPIRSSLVLLEELQLLNAAVAAIARSRLTGRGVLLVPKGVRFPTQPGQSDAQDDLIEVFMQVAETAIREPTSAAATVPIILEVPAEAIGDIRLVTFDSDFDEIAIKLREEAIRRFANGLEIPAEILLGLSDANHWSAWAISAEAVRLGVEPRLALIAHALTTQWLRPLLEDQNVEDAGEWLVWYDTSQLRAQANRAATALEAFKEGLISAAAARRETGFDEADAPTPSETRERDRQSGDDEEAPSNVTNLPVSETTSIPDTLAAAAIPSPGVLAAVDGVIWAALQAAGERLRNKPACPRSERARAREIVPAELHTVFPVDESQVDSWHLLDGAWARVPEIAARYGLDPECLTALLDDYARALIAARHPHTYEDTARVLRDSCMAMAA
ncbi:hypothetical protein [Streptomyces sp. TRM68367]|uniref:hypothetical protein n=1 Tax=Streptomyces sp. TRM68367 TaxID=2758415 RepID=UPI00165B70B1|nr:hypothetical protein [Streptomyces sp. TRM68367]MBC9729276.1 hypothetical protein [Streptomyces sp. TRM68367]